MTQNPPQTATLEDRLRAWAKGLYPLEAGTELLIRHGRAVYEGAPWIHDDGDRAWLDVETLVYESGAWSGGEQRVVRLAASLMGTDERVNLSDDVTGLDRETAVLVLAAIAHANGSHEHGDIEFDEGGRGRPVRLGSLYPWPDEG